MARLLCLVALLLVASAAVAEADQAKAPAPAPTAAAPVPPPVSKTFSLKVIIRNIATRPATLKLAIRGRQAAKPVVAQVNAWTAIGPVKVNLKVAVVVIYVTVKNNRGHPVTRGFSVKLGAFIKDITPDSIKYFSVEVSEVKSWGRQKLLLVKVGGKKQVLVVKL